MRRTAWLALLLLGLIAVPLPAQWEDGPGEVPYVPTPPEVVEAMLRLAAVTKDDIVYDLGCGDGRIVVTAAKKFQARGAGIDINPVRIQEAVENARQNGVSDRVRFVEKDLFQADFHDATVVTLYLLPEVNLRLRPKLLRDLKPGARIVSHNFDMGDWAPDKTVNIDHRKLYLWVVTAKAKQMAGGDAAAAAQGANIDGEWAYSMPTPNGDVDATLTLKTEGKRLTGTFMFGERRLEIQDGTVEGNVIKFTVKRERPQGGAMVYKMTGTVEGDQIKGKTETEMDGQSVSDEWSAKRK